MTLMACYGMPPCDHNAADGGSTSGYACDPKVVVDAGESDGGVTDAGPTDAGDGG